MKYYSLQGCCITLHAGVSFLGGSQRIFDGAFKCLDPGGSAHSVGHDSRDTQELDPSSHEERQTLHCP